MPLAFGLPYKETMVNAISATTLPPVQFPKGEVIGIKSDYAYLFEWDEMYAPKALYELQQAGLITKVATNLLSINTTTGVKKFDYGTILVPVKMQASTPEAMANLMQSIALKNGLKIYAMQSGNAIEGSDLGSSKFISLTKPTIAMLVGQGVNATDAGEVWHLLDQRMNINSTHLEIGVFNRVDLNNYTTLIMVGGSYGELNKEKLKAWVQNGGNLILLEEAVQWAAQNGVNNVVIKKIKSPIDSSQRLPYVQQEQINGAQQMNGAIFEANIDNTHPLAYGYNSKTVSMFKANKVFMEKSKNPYATPFYFGSSPLQSGYISAENLGSIKNSASVIVNTVGSGRIINIGENPNFRGFWLGGTKLMMNAIFFGKIIDGASARGE